MFIAGQWKCQLCLLSLPLSVTRRVYMDSHTHVHGLEQVQTHTATSKGTDTRYRVITEQNHVTVVSAPPPFHYQRFIHVVLAPSTPVPSPNYFFLQDRLLRENWRLDQCQEWKWVETVGGGLHTHWSPLQKKSLSCQPLQLTTHDLQASFTWARSVYKGVASFLQKRSRHIARWQGDKCQPAQGIMNKNKVWLGRPPSSVCILLLPCLLHATSRVTDTDRWNVPTHPSGLLQHLALPSGQKTGTLTII